MGRLEVVGEWIGRVIIPSTTLKDDRVFARYFRNFERDDGAGVSVSPSGGVQVDAGQERGEFGGGISTRFATASGRR